MPHKTALITGANKSIGFETARQLGRLGYRIWLGCRDADRGARAAETLSSEGFDVRVIAIDVADDGSVRDAAAIVEAADGRLDVLINNAGISGSYTRPGEQALSEIETVYQTNVFGPVRVTQAFLPLLRAAGQANVVMVSSGLGSLTWLSDPSHPYHAVNLLAYNSSKTALNAITVSLAKDLAKDGIKVNAADPGYTKTDFNNHTGYRTVEQAADTIVWLAAQDASGPTGGFFFERNQAPW
jgi:NAD(P)-dependent dehydrogenase (short-subunit alcohol dehydrogenase family)